MRDIAIIGVGELGGALAHVLARRDACASIALIDDHGRLAEGKALDLMQAAPIEGFAARVIGSPDLLRAGGADIIIVADRAGETEFSGEEGLRLVRRLAEIAPAALVLCAGASHGGLVDRAVRELHLDRRRIFGTAPEALAAGARSLVALVLDGSPRDISLTIVGNPPDHIIVPWESAAYAGSPLVGVLDEVSRRRVTARIAALWPPGPHALAACALSAVDAIFGRTRARLSCFVAPEGSAQHRTRTAATSVRFSRAGVETVSLPLSVVDRVAYDNATLL
jgi:malate dehydrogenase